MHSQLASEHVYAETRSDLFQHPSTKSLPPLNSIVGQDRAQQAVHFAMSMPGKGYNIYAVGHNGLGKRTMVMRYLKFHQMANGHIFDWIYVNNFDDARFAYTIQLPAGRGASFKKELEAIITRLLTAMPLAFDNDLYYSRADKIKSQLTTKQEAALKQLNEQAQQQGINLLLTPQGDYQFVALNGEEAHTEESFATLPAAEQDRLEEAIVELEKQLRGISRQMNEWEETFVEQQQKLESEVAENVMSHQFARLEKQFSDVPKAIEYIETLRNDIVENLDVFLDDKEIHTDLAYALSGKKIPRRYQVNLLVSHGAHQFPVVVEESPSYHTLFGYVENATYKGTVVTDFTLLRSGSMHQANGGVLLMDAIKVLERPYVWDGLKKALRSRQLDFSSLEREVTLSGSLSMEPQPIPLNVKIILFGDRQTYRLLQQYDPEFTELFRVTADFEEDMERTAEGEQNYAQFISSIVNENGLNHCDRSALCRVIEYAARQAEDQFKLSLHSGEIANLLREAHYWAVQSESTLIRSKHIEQALESREMRVSRARDLMHTTYIEGAVKIDVSGERVGQVNALTVLNTGEFSFGMPSRLTATCAAGDVGVVAIERQVELSGAIHSKGVLILTAFLESLFAQQRSLPIKASLTFEQNYGGIDGDSASMAEFIALISAIANVPVQQNMAITGSMDQFGEAQAIGGVNEKVEGFVDVARSLAYEGRLAVIIPLSNARHLMLKKALRQEIEKEKLQVYTVETVFDAIELMTGMAWKGEGGIHERVVEQLSHYPGKKVDEV
ncbi:Lon protease family protein [Thaumasiovibrio sp. DFM-14]|uniref:Lon protease family protein n=1 Tax=Thaumasiovibrio sp. DFM-14 TaxID=3384792 RepID=UPI0039A366DC